MKLLAKIIKKQTIISLVLVTVIVGITVYTSYATLFKLDSISIAKAHTTENLRITFGNNGYDQQIHAKELTAFKDHEAINNEEIKINNIYLTNNADHLIRYKIFLKNVDKDNSIIADNYSISDLIDYKYLKYQINNEEILSLSADNLLYLGKTNNKSTNNLAIKVFISDDAKLVINNKQLHLQFIIEEIPQNRYGEEKSLANIIINENGGIDQIKNKNIPNYNLASIINEGIYYIKDNDGDSFIYRGVANNNVALNINDDIILLFKILRINGDGSIRLVLSQKDIVNYDLLKGKINENYRLNDWFNQIFSSKKDYLVSNYYCNYPNNYNELICPSQSKKQIVGTLSKTEAILAGSTNIINNTLFYLAYNDDVWLLENSYLSKGKIIKTNNDYSTKYYLPVINIKGNLIVESGDGGVDNPFKLDLKLNEE